MIVAGTKLARHEIRSKIGEGGMGEVYLAATDKSVMSVAVKGGATFEAGTSAPLFRNDSLAKDDVDNFYVTADRGALNRHQQAGPNADRDVYRRLQLDS